MSIIADVHPGSLADKAGLRAGMSILRVNDREIRDIIDWKYALANPVMRIEALDGEQQLLFRVRHDSGGDIGLSFVSPTLDKLKLCKNNCLFCFVKQMPPDQRESLYIKDDDFRLSLVYGSFVTLTNLTEADFLRIEQENISPIYVSVHTTNPNLRAT
ncbi:MAG: PDZ domain-containing protein, partial [Bacillota bacterium]|nr:PDZ domain-containing protein [Bacillota bacterium]